jgi:predicted Ser/Thr protein kinase
VSEFPKPGDLFNVRYRLEEVIGAGGLGKVFKAFQSEPGRHIALKIMHPEFAGDDESRQRFLREARALSLLNHANLVTVYHLGITPSGLAFIAMELIKGISLRRLLEQEVRLPTLRVLAIALQLCDALSYVHQHGITHRDIKPDNIILVDSPEPDTVKLIDFGLARISSEPKITQTGLVVGSINYMSPEQWKGMTADSRADIYSLALCLYEMFSGRKAFQSGAPVELMYKHMNEPVKSIAKGQVDRFAPAINEIIARASAKSPGERYQSAAELKDALLELRQTLEGVKPSARERSLGKVALVATVAAICLAPAAAFLHYRAQMETKQSVPVTSAAVKEDLKPVQRRATEDYGREEMNELAVAVKHKEERYRSASNSDEKIDAAEQLYAALNQLFHQQLACREFAGAEKTMTAALALAVVIDPSSGNTKALILNQLALCKLSVGDLPSAESALKKGFACKRLSLKTKMKLARNRLLLNMRSHRYEDADRDFKFIAATESQEIVDEKGAAACLGRVEDLCRETVALSKESPMADTETISFLIFLNDINDFLISNRSRCCAESLPYSLTVLMKIPPRTSGLRMVARRTYELLSRFEEEINKDRVRAAEYKQKSRTLNI